MGTQAIYFFLSMISDFIALLAQGFALKCLWSWFIVTSFSTRQIGFMEACGLILFTFFFKQISKQEVDNVDVEDENSMRDMQVHETITNVVLKPGSVLLFGWLISLFI